MYDEYKCITPCYTGGALYKVGSILRLPPGSNYKSDCFILAKKAKAVEGASEPKDAEPKEEKPKAPAKKKSTGG